MRISRASLMVIVGLFISPICAAQSIHSEFDVDAEGWLAYGTPFQSGHISVPGAAQAVAHDAVNGVPPGSIRVGDVFGDTAAGAPSSFLGNRAVMYGGDLSYKVYVRFSDGLAYPAVYLVGPTMTLYHSGPNPVPNAWTSVQIPLLPSSWRVNAYNGPVATEGQLLTVLSNLQGLFLRTEWATGPDDTNVDDVRLDAQAFPEYGHGCPGTGGLIPNLAIGGNGSPGGTVQMDITQGVGGGSVWFFLGPQQAAIPASPGCNLNVTPVSAIVGPLPLFPIGAPGPGAGSLTTTWVIPSGTSGVMVSVQGFVIDPGGIDGYSNSQGVQVAIQ